MLKLNKIHIENFTKIKTADIDFNAPVILFTGENASGKSSVLDAIAICLAEHKRSSSFGEYINYNADKAIIKLSAFINKDPISFDIEINGREKTNVEKIVKYNGETYKNSEVSALLEKLGLLYYSDILFSMQDEEDITKMSPTKRADFLKKLLSFDYSNQLKKIKEDEAANEAALLKAENDINYKTSSIDARKLEIKNEIPLPYTRGELSEFNSKIIEINQQILDYNEKVEKNSKIQNEIFELKNQISNIKNNISKNEYSISISENLINQQNDIRNQISNIEHNIEELNKKLVEANSLNPSLISERNNITKSINEDTIKANEIFKNISILNAEKANLVKQISLAEKGKCPTCGQSFTDECKKSLLDEQAENEKKLNELSNSYNEIKSHIDDLNNQVNNINLTIHKNDLECNFISSNINNETNNINSYKTKLLPDIESKKEEIKTIKNNISSDQSLIVSNEDKIKELESKIIYVERPDTSLINEYKSKIDNYNNVVAQNKFIVDNNKNIELIISNTEKEIEEIKNKIIVYNDNIELYKNAKKIFDKDLPNYLIVKTCAKIQGTMNDFIQGIFPDMVIRLMHSKKGVEFFYTPDKCLFKEDELTKENMSNIKMASGFERAVLSIAFKEALCRAYNLPFCVLDEVDKAASDFNSEKMFESIVCGGFFDQSLIISHKSVVREIIKDLTTVKSYLVNNGSFILEN